MSKNQIAAKIRQLRELEELIDEAQAEADAVRDSIKSYMGDKEEVKAGGYRVTWRTVKGHRFDSTALKRAMPDTYAAFTRETITRRFCVV